MVIDEEELERDIFRLFEDMGIQVSYTLLELDVLCPFSGNYSRKHIVKIARKQPKEGELAEISITHYGKEYVIGPLGVMYALCEGAPNSDFEIFLRGFCECQNRKRALEYHKEKVLDYDSILRFFTREGEHERIKYYFGEYI